MFRIDFKKTNLARIVLILFIVFLATEVSSSADDACLKDIVVTNTRDDLLVYFDIEHCFTNQMVTAIQNGVPTTFNFLIQLFENRDYAWDKKIADLRVSHSVRYDSLKKTYFVTLSEKNGKVIPVKDFDEVKNLMSGIVGVKVARLWQLRKNSRYKVRMMAELEKIKLPFRLHYVLFFLSLWDFETEWYTVEFRY